ncbi:MAG: hypothetical protein ACYTEL_11820 [Planctomycetota bacterium]
MGEESSCCVCREAYWVVEIAAVAFGSFAMTFVNRFLDKLGMTTRLD